MAGNKARRAAWVDWALGTMMASDNVLNTLQGIYARCDEVGDCWIWRDAVTRDGYPIFKPHGCQCTLVRRAVFVLAGGVLKARQPVVASCNEKRCVNPAHLSASSLSKVARHAVKMGTFYSPTRGANIAAARRKNGKISVEIAAEIRASNEPSRVLAQRYGVNKTVICSVRRGASWRDYSNPFAGLMR